MAPPTVWIRRPNLSTCASTGPDWQRRLPRDQLPAAGEGEDQSPDCVPQAELPSLYRALALARDQSESPKGPFFLPCPSLVCLLSLAQMIEGFLDLLPRNGAAN